MYGFSCAYNQSREEIVRHLEDVIESRGGSFRGDTEGGEFSFGKRLGKLSGHYHFAESKINIEIMRKPVYFSHHYIERMISAYFRRQLIGTESSRQALELV